MKEIKPWFKIFFVAVFLIIGFSVAIYPMVNELIPKSHKGDEADELAQKMLKALNFEKWRETRWVSWDFSGNHHYIWDKKNDLVFVSWKKYKVFLKIGQRQKSVVLRNEQPLKNENDKQKVIEAAWKYFCNDSFWLIAPFKVFDAGTSRSIVIDKNGKKNLLINYESGGVTPGDSYLWELNNDGVPLSFKMWVSIIPIGGVKATWGSWLETTTGVKIAAHHRLFLFLNLRLNNIRTGKNFEDIGLNESPFVNL